ncbi:GNAT family N-acetyltransferase [Roseibium sp.]|uniref:GNAT family N-acetyltransferase n=1 Tax=Roseibium sp. TaxID=1936156 RepID=UPI003A96A8A3
MEIVEGHAGREGQISDLFRESFTASEGAGEGHLVGQLAADMMQLVPPEDLFVFSAVEAGKIAGCIMFSRLDYEKDSRTVFLLAPVAVRTDRQRSGIGTRLISFGLEELRRGGVDVAITYGDPDYYSRVGFRQISEDTAQAPLSLNFPHGWLAQSLDGKLLQPLAGLSRCVGPLNKPELW